MEGEPGIGKTTVWRAAVEAARGRSYRVLVCRASESERAMKRTTPPSRDAATACFAPFSAGDPLEGRRGERLPRPRKPLNARDQIEVHGSDDRQLRGHRAILGGSPESPSTHRVSSCPACGEENPARAKFCLECGAALAVATPPAALEERKVVTRSLLRPRSASPPVGAQTPSRCEFVLVE
jgi:Double zinc ribbon